VQNDAGVGDSAKLNVLILGEAPSSSYFQT